MIRLVSLAVLLFAAPAIAQEAPAPWRNEGDRVLGTCEWLEISRHTSTLMAPPAAPTDCPQIVAPAAARLSDNVASDPRTTSPAP